MKRSIATLLSLALAGCASFSDDGGFSTVQSLAKPRLNATPTQADDATVERTLRELLARPISADDAVTIALVNNPGLRATYADLRIAEAQYVQAGRLSNPHFHYFWARRQGERKIEWALTAPVIDLLTMPLRRQIEGERFERTKLEVAKSVVATGIDARRAFYRAVAAAELARYAAQVREAAEASAMLARRMAEVGNWSQLNRMREQVFYAEAVTLQAQAERNATAERERLTRVLGLYGEDIRYRLPERLPDLPGTRPAFTELEAKAIADRLDIQAARRETEGLAASLGLTRATRFINVLDLGPAAVKEGHEPWKRGFELNVELPLFDWGGAKVAHAEATYMQAVHRVAEIAVNARSEVRDSYAGLMTAYDTARHYREEIVPLRKKISEENLLRYNGMLMSVFELLADAREQIGAVTGYINALKEFWLSEADLQATLAGAGTEARAPMQLRTSGAAAPAGH